MLPEGNLRAQLDTPNHRGIHHAQGHHSVGR